MIKFLSDKRSFFMPSYRVFTENDHRGTLQVARPEGYLSYFVDYYWQSVFTPGNEDYVYSHALPHYSGLISFNLNRLSWQSTELPAAETFTFQQSKIFGSLNYSCLCTYPRGLHQAGIKLKPGALSMLLGIPASDLPGLKENFNSFFSFSTLEEQLQSTDTFIERVILMENLLVRHLPASAPDYRYILVQEALARFDTFLPYGNAVRQIADDLCITHKSLTRYFQQWVGLSPKWCLKVHRFTKAFNAYQRVSQLPYENYGYNDHSHLYKDALALAGLPISLL